MNRLDEIYIAGGYPIGGQVRIQGSKNAALPMMAAALLHRGISVLRGCPRILDVFCMEEILKKLGAKTIWKDHDLYLDCTCADQTEIPKEYAGKMRSSVILLGVLLAREGKGSIGYPGGCVIGKRPVDMHLDALRRLGAKVVCTGELIQAKCSRLCGGEIRFARSSVGATQQAILAGVTAKGETILENCAMEPEVCWLCRYLRTMGACIKGEGSRRIQIKGTEYLGPGDLEVPPDRIVAGTYMCAAAATRSEIFLKNVPLEEMGAFLEAYRKMGGQYSGDSGKLKVSGREVKNPVCEIETQAYPGFPTDLQSPVMAVLTTIPGENRIRETIFEDRFRSAYELVRMGADIRIEGREAVIRGGSPLTGCTVAAGELRGGAALVIAALAAEGETCVIGAGYI